jgi:hypothetical protein
MTIRFAKVAAEGARIYRPDARAVAALPDPLRAIRRGPASDVQTGRWPSLAARDVAAVAQPARKCAP